MGRGKIEIKKIENQTNRQVTYSKRRNGIFKKAQELSVLCDAKVSIIMFSNSNKFHEYITPSTTTKKIYDEYQQTLGIDLWSTHYQRMQEDLRQKKEIKNRLRREIGERIGGDLSGMDIYELSSLEEKVAESLAVVRARKYHVIKTSTQTYAKKVKNWEERNGNLLLNFEAKCEDPQYGLVDDDDDGDYDSSVAFTNGVSNTYAFRLQPSHLNLHHGRGGFGSCLTMGGQISSSNT